MSGRRVRLEGYPGRPATPPGAVRIDRGTRFGNPYRIGDRFTREESMAWHRRFLRGEPEAVDLAREVGWKSWRRSGPELCADVRATIGPKGTVACWCELHEHCHGDLLVRVATGEDP